MTLIEWYKGGSNDAIVFLSAWKILRMTICITVYLANTVALKQRYQVKSFHVTHKIILLGFFVSVRHYLPNKPLCKLSCKSSSFIWLSPLRNEPIIFLAAIQIVQTCRCVQKILSAQSRLWEQLQYRLSKILLLLLNHSKTNRNISLLRENTSNFHADAFYIIMVDELVFRKFENLQGLAGIFGLWKTVAAQSPNIIFERNSSFSLKI